MIFPDTKNGNVPWKFYGKKMKEYTFSTTAISQCCLNVRRILREYYLNIPNTSITNGETTVNERSPSLLYILNTDGETS